MIIEVKSLDQPGVEVYGSLTEAQLRNRLDPARGIFIAESPKVIAVALDAGYEPLSLLCECRHLTGDAAPIIARCGDIPIFTGERDLLASLTGYTLTRGVLCAMRRPMPLPVVEVCRDARRVVLLTPTSCDPLNRRAVRVSMGSVFLVPWTWLEQPIQSLNSLGFKTVAMALTDRSVPIDNPALCAEPRLAIIMGTEGDGLAHDTIHQADYVARIPMQHGVDSLNVAAAAALAFWQLRPQD